MKRTITIHFLLFICTFFLSCSSNKDNGIEGLWFVAKEYYYYDSDSWSIEEYDLNNPEPDSKKWKISSIDGNNGSITIYEYGLSGWDKGRMLYYTLKSDTLWIYIDEDHIDGPYKMPITISSKDKFVLTELPPKNTEIKKKYEFVRLE